MTSTLSDLTRPAQPPPDGARALLAYTAVTVAVYLAGVFLVILITISTAQGSPRPAQPGAMVTLWNRLCASLEAQNGALQALNDSLHARHPDRVREARRLELYTQAIVESERQTALLKALRRAEFGKAGEGKKAGEDEAPRDSVPGLRRVDVPL